MKNFEESTGSFFEAFGKDLISNSAAFICSLFFVMISLSSCTEEVSISPDSLPEKRNRVAEYHAHTHEAGRFYLNGQYAEALECYYDAFEINTPFHNHLITAAECANNIDSTGIAIELLKMAILQGFEYQTIIELGTFYELQEEPEWLELKEQYPDLRREFFSTIDIDLYSELIRMKATDKLLRPYWRDSSAMKILQEVYKTNMEKLLSLTAQYGFPGHLAVGYYSEITYTILLHGTPEVLNRKDFYQIDSLLMKELHEGNLLPFYYADWKDKGLWRSKQKQLYGIINQVDENGFRQFDPIDDVSAVDQLRENIYLESLDDYAYRIGIELPSGYRAHSK